MVHMGTKTRLSSGGTNLTIRYFIKEGGPVNSRSLAVALSVREPEFQKCGKKW
jgi:hypothetical protein